MFDILRNLGENFAAIFALIFLFCAFSYSLHRRQLLLASLVNGTVFALTAVYSMNHPIRILEGVIIDARVVLVALAGVFGGPGASAVAALIVAGYRWHLGGIGTIPGILAVAVAAWIGAKSPWEKIQETGNPARRLWLLGFALAGVSLAATFLLPWPLAWRAIQNLSLPVAVFYPLATVLFGSLFGFEIARRSMVEKLVRSESLLRTISNNFEEGMIYQVQLEKEGRRRFTYLSESVRKLYGITPEQGMADPGLLYRRIHEEDLERMEKEEEKARRNMSTFKTEARIREPSGGIRWSSFASRPQAHPDGSITWDGIEFVITERKLAEEERRRIDERMGNAHKLEALGVLVAGVAHNINNVLAAIMGTASFHETTTKDPSERNAFGVIVTACKRGRDVVRSLMQFARPTLSDQGPLDLLALLSEVRVLLQNTTQNKIGISEDFPTESVWVHGDAGSLSNSFMNLCLNAMDAMPAGTGSIRIQVDVSAPGQVDVRFVDDGEGMAPETLARVMEPFFTTKPVGKGTGLGLSMAHGVVKAHGGSMELDSAPGVGTTVKIRLPRISRPVASPAVEEDKTPSRLTDVLLVDDDEDVRFLVARMLKAKGMKVETVGSGQAALDRLDEGYAPDLIILDQNMPGLDGIQTMERIRARNIAVPLLISSGQPDIQDWASLRQPNVAILSKPFDMAELQAKLTELNRKAG